MIKIQINDLENQTVEYSNAVSELVAFRILILQKSLSHLNGGVVNFDEGDFASFKAITKEIVTTVGDSIGTLNGRPGYIDAVNIYRATPNNLDSIDRIGLLNFCEDILGQNNERLSNLLTWDADSLMNFNNGLLNGYGINTPLNIKILKLAFDYKKFEEIATAIKEYFRKKTFTKVCSYCNLEKTFHQTNKSREVVKSFELDHFYDKGRYPLLSYCLFNLVPSDHACNVTNKGQIEFNDEFHLNPYIGGYNNKINFIPFGLTTAYEVTSVDIEISEAEGSVMYKKINGNNKPDVEEGQLGNLNVFKIRSKYKDETHRAGLILKTIHKENKHFKHLKKYLSNFSILDRKVAYLSWYEKELNGKFKSSDFNEKEFSKFCRDIHDYYFNKNATTRLNRYIIDLINAH